MMTPIRFVSRWSIALRKTALGVLTTMCLFGLSLTARAQEGRMITFDAPGADTTPGDNNGTYPSSINDWGVVTGSYQDANTVYHGFLRSAEGKFIIFEVPGADTTAGSYNGTSPSSINDLGVVTGSYWDANSFSHGFLRSPNGKFTTFDVPGAGGYGSTPIAINWKERRRILHGLELFVPCFLAQLPMASSQRGLVQTRAYQRFGRVLRFGSHQYQCIWNHRGRL